MNEEHDKAWSDLARRVRHGERHVISGAEADRLLRELPGEGISDTDMEAIVGSVVSGRPFREVRVEEAAPADDDAAARAVPECVEEDVLQLNRNKGAEDADAESTLDELRREALEDDDEEDQGQ
ncbi:MAG: hypothetical protein H6716_25045 [Polyangiaceae bacterium]|nr:hypothetical protein [Polyangiaceae bacterium]